MVYGERTGFDGPYEGTGGTKPMNIGGRVRSERERLTGMTAEERAWRKKWIQDQFIREEPRYVAAARTELLNPIRRFYQFPLNFIFTKFVGPFTGQDNALVLRFYTGRIIMGLMMAYAGFYYFKYNTNTWQSRSGWRVIEGKTAVYPGEPGYPAISPPKEPFEYNDRGFKTSIMSKEFPQYKKFHKDD